MKGAWFVNSSRKSNFDKLEQWEKNEIEQQIDKMVRSKYTMLHYNGLNERKLKKLQNEAKLNGSDNYFDNKVVIIDEVHNLVGMIVNKLNSGKKKSISYKIYEMLMSAKNCRLVFLSGTPIVNYPNEIAILYNMLRGYIRSYSLPIKPKRGKKINDLVIQKILKKTLLVDFVKYN